MSATPTAALRWAINALDQERFKDEVAAARCELLDLIEDLAVARGVVAAQREALRECDAVIAVMTSYIDDLLDRARVANTPSLAHRDSAGPFGHYAQARLEELVGKVSALVVARAALDAEGVSEPGAHGTQGDPAAVAGYSPREEQSPGSLTSPVDTARRRIRESGPWGWISEPRGYVEHGPDGPQAVYHAETPDTYLAKGDRP